MGYVADAMLYVSKLNTTTEEKTGGEPRKPAIVVTSAAVGGLPKNGLVAHTAVLAMLVVPKNDARESLRINQGVDFRW